MSVKIKATAITVSDSRTENNDISGNVLIECLQEINSEIVGKFIVVDEKDKIIALLEKSVESSNLIITSGGTGISARDNTPEATKIVIEKELPGFSEAMRIGTFNKTPLSILTRGICGTKGNCLIINLPGSPKGVRECFDIIKPAIVHAVNQLNGLTKH